MFVTKGPPLLSCDSNESWHVTRWNLLEILESQCVFEATQHHLRYPELQYCEPLQARPDTGS